VVNGLPGLKELQLGGWQAFEDIGRGGGGFFVDQWGQSARWMWVVKERALTAKDKNLRDVERALVEQIGR